MSRNTYLIVAVMAILFGTIFNYSLVGGTGAGSRVHGGGTHIGTGGGFGGGHK